MPSLRRVGLGSGLFLVLTAGTDVPAVPLSCGDGTVDLGEACDDGPSNGSVSSCCDVSCAFAAGKSPDLIVGQIPDVFRYGGTAGITAYGIGAEACNLGSCWLRWYGSLPDHPVIAQNMFRLRDGRFEQIGQSWVKHTFAAIDGSECAECISPPDSNHLGVNCSDPYAAGGNGIQRSLGPRADVDPHTGTFPFPDPRITTTGNVIFKRLQVHDTDLDPAENPGARYFVEVQYVTADDPGSAHGDDNVSYREVSVDPAPYDLQLAGGTESLLPAIHAWKRADPGVFEAWVDEAGLIVVASRATPAGPGTWRYEYALQNVSSQRAVRSFRVPLPLGTTVTNVGFHDVDYHSGEPFDGTDWTAAVTVASLTWSTATFAANPNANALRWGTLYNFRFDANVPPGKARATVSLFRPGSPGSFFAPTVAPERCFGLSDGSVCEDGDACTQGETCSSGVCTAAATTACPGDTPCREAGCDPVTGGCASLSTKPEGAFCDDGTECTFGETCTGGLCVGSTNPAPDEVDGSLHLFTDAGVTVLYWSEVAGSTTYQLLRGSLSGFPVGPGGEEEACVDPATQGAATFDPEDPAPDQGFWYLVRGANGCGPGPYGYRFENGAPTVPRESTSCP